MSKWYEKSYRRNLVDMHIEDWDEEFLSKFSPQEYVDNMKLAQVQSCMVYANSHVGHCYWPTKVGNVHANMKDMDWFGETIRLVRDAGMDAIAYYTINFINYEYETHEEWRMRDANGRGSREEGCISHFYTRYGLVCPNNKNYREYVDRHVGELIESYELDGIFYDMNFWPMFCVCDACKERYKKETGKEIPTTLDWNDPEWLQFQAKREEWLVDMAEYLWNIVKSRKPNMTVEHNFAPAMLSWNSAWTDKLADWVDFNSGDNYGNMDWQSFINKLHNTLTKNLPYEFMTSRCYPTLLDHTSIKPKDMLYLENAITLANGGAFFFIDAINPDGSMCREPYEIMGEIFEKSKKYEPYLGGRLKADVAIYMSVNSNFDPTAPPVETNRVVTGAGHMSLGVTFPQHSMAAISAARILKENHIPYTVLTKQNLKHLNQYSILVMTSINLIDEEEERQIKEWVQGGGKLYITGTVPLPMVMEMLDIEFQGYTDSLITYINATDIGKFVIEGTYNQTTPVTVFKPQMKVKSNGNAEVLATIGLPYTNPVETKFSSIHSNPPGIVTDIPAMLLGEYGKGKVLWSSASCEAAPSEFVSQNKIFKNAVEKLADSPWIFKSDGSPYVDITLIDQQQESRYLVSFVNLQSNRPVIPIHDFKVSINTMGKKITKVLQLPDEAEINFQVTDGYVEFTLKQLEFYDAVLVCYA